MEPWLAVDAQNGGLQGSRFRIRSKLKIYDKTNSLQAQYMDQQTQKLFRLLSYQLQQNRSSWDTGSWHDDFFDMTSSKKALKVLHTWMAEDQLLVAR